MELVNRWYESFDHKADDTYRADISRQDDLKQEMLKGIINRINAAESNEEHAHASRISDERESDVSIHRTFLKVAAVLLVGIGAGIFFYPQKADVENKRFINPDQFITDNTTPVGVSHPVIYLADGTVVWLEPKSTLEYPDTFNGNLREVRLVGEAFFDVARNEGKPFVIHSPNFSVRVLGTSFHVKAYPDDEVQEVEVVTGQVIVSVQEPSGRKITEVVLKPNQKAIYTKKDSSLVEGIASEEVIRSSSVKSKLAFNEVSLEDIVRVLSAVHEVNISLAREDMKGCIITADLTNEPLDISVATLAKAINGTYTTRERNIVLDAEGCSKP